MKTIVATLLLICAVNLLIAQKAEKTIDIIFGTMADRLIPDTSSAGHKSGDLYIYRMMDVNHWKDKGGGDSVMVYEIHFIRQLGKMLINYGNIEPSDLDFDKARYTWLTDSIVDIALMNSKTKETFHTVLKQPSVFEECCIAKVIHGNLNMFSRKPEKIVEIKEKRHPYNAVMDTSTGVQKVGDVSIDRISMSANADDGAYRINIMLLCENKPTVHKMNFIKKDDFDKISYSWISDVVVSITFINSVTNVKRKLMLVQIPNEYGDCSLGFIKDHSEEFFDE